MLCFILIRRYLLGQNVVFYPNKTLFIVTKHNLHTHLLCVSILESVREREWTRRRERETRT